MNPRPARDREIAYGKFVDLVGKLRCKLLDKDLHAPILYGVERGGVIPAVYLAHLLKVPFRSLRKCEMPPSDESGRDIIVVDDILDTGETYRRLYGSVTHYAVLLSRRELPKVVYGELYCDNWVTFPWEEFHQDHMRMTGGSPTAPS